MRTMIEETATIDSEIKAWMKRMIEQYSRSVDGILQTCLRREYGLMDEEEGDSDD